MDSFTISIIVSFLTSGFLGKFYLKIGGLIGKNWQEKSFTSSKILRWLIRGFGIFALSLDLLMLIFWHNGEANLLGMIIFDLILVILFCIGMLFPYLKQDPNKFSNQANKNDIGMNTTLTTLAFLLFINIPTLLITIFPSFTFITPDASKNLITVLGEKLQSIGVLLFLFADFIVWGWPHDPPKRKKKEVRETRTVQGTLSAIRITNDG